MIPANVDDGAHSSFFVLVKGGAFFLIRIEGLRIEGVVCCTDCKAP